MTYKIKTDSSGWGMSLGEGIKEAASKHARRYDNRGQLEGMQDKIDYLCDFIGGILEPLLKHNFLTEAQVDQLLPQGLSIINAKDDD